MPCIYAHDSFGKKVLAKLPEEIKTIIENHQKEFEAGLQGPDFLFFYHPMIKSRTNQMGYWQHGQPIDKYLRHLLPVLRKEGQDSGAYAYVLGFICHYMLDSECHTFVIPLSKRPGYHHLSIEHEFDRHLLRRDGHRPVTYPMWKKVVCNRDIVQAIFKAYKPLRLSKREIKEALLGMRFYKWLLTGGYSIKRLLVRFLMHLTLHYEQLEGHMMTLHPKSYARKTNQSLQFIYDNAISLTSDILQDFHRSVWEGKPLHKRFSCTFKSNEAQ
ncbi:MAG: zinc dependent phospholipase C family protein [Lachnospiraceae bacterium]|nr:zinc dependent phospholipase C family protein [Lachnospiraceae bacterium]